jgi:aminoglycoside phosphotransferase (APT) family kinase protein
MIPTVLGGWQDPRGGYLLLSRLPGAPPDQHTPGRLTHEALCAIAPLHRLESSIVAVDPRLLDRWVGAPVAAMARALPDGEVLRSGLRELEKVLRCRLQGRSVTLGWSHGDLHPGNLLVWPDGVVRGILDWGGARPDSFPALDPAHWLLTTAAAHGHRALGKEVAERLARGEYWHRAEAELIGSAACGHGLPDDALLLLTWLAHVHTNLQKSARYGASPLWWRRNVLPVLRAVHEVG